MVNFTPCYSIFAYFVLIARQHQNKQILFFQFFVIFEEILRSFCLYDFSLKCRRKCFAQGVAT